MIELTIEAKRACRREVGVSVARGYQTPVRVVPGDSAPAVRGHGFFYTTPSGKTIVRYPKAYGWQTLYHPSTRRIVVGRAWLESKGLL